MAEELLPTTVNESGELQIEAAPMETDTDDAEFQRRANLAREPKDPDFHISNFKAGTLLEVFNPYYRIVKVAKTLNNSCLMNAWAWANHPRRVDDTHIADHWQKDGWLETWALRTVFFTNTQDPRRSMRQEQHVLVTRENRSGTNQGQSPLIQYGTYCPRPDDPPIEQIEGPYVMCLPLKDENDAIRGNPEARGQGAGSDESNREAAQQKADPAVAGQGSNAGAVRERLR